MAFKVGDIITGTEEHNGYTLTTSNSVMLVINTNERSMDVKILGMTNSLEGRFLGSVFGVDNSASNFKHTTIEDFLEENAGHCRTLNIEEIERLLAEYPSNTEKTSVKELVPEYEFTDEERKALHDEIMPLLRGFHYNPTEEAIDKILDEWRKNKAPLLELFKKHPNYNGKYQIAFDFDYCRVIDRKVVYNFRDWLYYSDEVKDLFKKEVQVGNVTYPEIYKELRKLDNIIYYFEEYNYDEYIETINGKTLDEHKAERNHFRSLSKEYYDTENVSIVGNQAFDATLWNKYIKVNDLINILGNTDAINQFVTEYAERKFNNYFEDMKIKAGQKLSRAVNKILCSLGVDKAPNYNKEFAKFADAVNPLKIKRHTVISIHPVDYFTMSFGNSWSSCHTIDKQNDREIDSDHNYQGCNSSGTMSYMLDETSVVFYTVDAAYNGDNLELEDKINRCMFHYYDNRLLQGRVYPQSNDEGANDLYKDIREIAHKVFADMLEVPNIWTNKKGAWYCEDETSSKGTHYRDYANYDNCNISTLKDGRDSHELIPIGHIPICVKCGETHNYKESIECSDCWNW